MNAESVSWWFVWDNQENCFSNNSCFSCGRQNSLEMNQFINSRLFYCGAATSVEECRSRFDGWKSFKGRAFNRQGRKATVTVIGVQFVGYCRDWRCDCYNIQIKPWQINNLRRDGCSFMWHQPCQRLSTPLRWIFKKRAIKKEACHSCRTTGERSESAQESGE